MNEVGIVALLAKLEEVVEGSAQFFGDDAGLDEIEIERLRTPECFAELISCRNKRADTA